MAPALDISLVRAKISTETQTGCDTYSDPVHGHHVSTRRYHGRTPFLLSNAESVAGRLINSVVDRRSRTRRQRAEVSPSRAVIAARTLSRTSHQPSDSERIVGQGQAFDRTPSHLLDHASPERSVHSLDSALFPNRSELLLLPRSYRV
jgi:hypothetical protein